MKTSDEAKKQPRAASRLGALALLLSSLTLSRYDPPVREKVVLSFRDMGSLRLSVETSFKQGEGLR